MSRADIDNFDQRWVALDSDFQQRRPRLQEINSFLMPFAGRFYVQDRKAKTASTIFDNAGSMAVNVLGAGLMAGATSPARPWVRVVTGVPELDRQHSIRGWLDEVTRMILRVFAKSNTYRALHSMYEEVSCFGTAAAIVLQDDSTVLHCHVMTIGEYRLGTNYKGEVDSCYRTFEKTAHEMVSEFGPDSCSQVVRDALKDRPDARFVVRHVIEPRTVRDPEKRDNKNMPWKSVYYEVGNHEGRYLRESGFERFPVVAPRWAVAGTTAVYGYGPGDVALGDVKQLQHEQLRKAQGIDYTTLPPMFAPNEMKGQEFKWAPGGVVFTPSTANGNALKQAFEVKLNLEHLLADIEDVRARIRKAFYADLFLMLTFQGNNQRMTATEVAERHEEKLIQLGPVLERLHTELLAPLVRIAFEELDKAGLLPPPPPELLEQDLTLEFVSVLAQAQRAAQVTAIERALGVAGGVAQLLPDIVDNVDPDELWAELTDTIGVSPRISRSPEARTKLREAKLAAQAEAAKAQLAQTQASTAKDLAASPTDQPNALRDLMSMFSGYSQPSPAYAGQ